MLLEIDSGDGPKKWKVRTAKSRPNLDLATRLPRMIASVAREWL